VHDSLHGASVFLGRAAGTSRPSTRRTADGSCTTACGSQLMHHWCACTSRSCRHIFTPCAHGALQPTMRLTAATEPPSPCSIAVKRHGGRPDSTGCIAVSIEPVKLRSRRQSRDEATPTARPLLPDSCHSARRKLPYEPAALISQRCRRRPHLYLFLAPRTK